MTGQTPQPPLKSLVWPMRLTLAGLWAERLARAFWPLWSLILVTLAALAFGVQDLGPLHYAQAAGAVIGLAALALLAWGVKQFRKPTAMDALDRLDTTMPGRPIAALRDTQAIGTADPASLAVWRAHQERMAARAAGARPVQPDLRISSRDRFSLRYVALTAFVMAALFGSFWKAGSVAGLTPGAAVAMPGGPAWEGWAQPPAYTGKPSLYLNDITDPALELPTGTRLQVRLYGPEGDLSVVQTIADVPPPPAAEAGATPAAAVPNAMAGVHDLTVTRSGQLSIEGNGGREWQITAIPDNAPTIEITGEMVREADGRFKQDFKATDDYGVVAGRVTISLDLAKVDRRHGLTIDPEAIEPVTLDLPMPRKGKRTDMTSTLVDDLSKHVFANMPVTMVFAAVDAAGNEGTSAPYEVVLHGKRFFDPLAAALIEMRRDMLWNRVNAPRAVEILKAVTNRPEGFIRHERAFLHLRVLMRDLEAKEASLSTEDRDAIAEKLWTIALMVEEGNLQSALERLQRAQDRLQEAIENGASPEEIDQLMKEMQQALNEYMRELAEEAQRNPGDQQQQQMMQGQMMSGDQLQEMLDRLQQLMEEGKTAEAAELMEQLRQLMQNMQVVQGQGQGQGQGQDGPMGDLGETLRDQQELSDDAFRDLQGVPRDGQQQGEGQQPGQEQGQEQGQGQQPGDQPGQGSDQAQNQDGEGQGGSLSDRQRELRERLNELQQGQLPGDGTEQGEEGRRNLDRAGRAMEEAEDALRDGDLDGALDRQAEAMEALRDGMRDFGEALADEQRQNRDGQGGERDMGSADPQGTDPLGRRPGETARIGSDENMVQNTPDERAQELLDEIRRRSGELTRPLEELDYLKRLLQMF